MNPSLSIASSQHEYPIYIEEDLRFEAYSLINHAVKEDISSYFIIVDEAVEKLYLNEFLSSFPKEVKPIIAVIPSGESSKSMKELERLLTIAIENGLDRKSLIIAFGGGVTGDLAGFTAATFMRGIRFVQVPTTLLAHDSSVGGKTGINHPFAKNMIGSFHAPSAVLYDVTTLYSLSEEQWRSGYAEVVKHGFIKDVAFLSWLEENVGNLLSIKPKVLIELLSRSIKVKAAIVEEDEREQGVRAYLNFGHTLAHSIEAELGYGKKTHGEAVAIGMFFALSLGEEVYGQKLETTKVRNYLKSLGFDLQIPQSCSAEALLQRMKADKKTTYNKIRFVLLKELGEPELREIAEEVIIRVLRREGVK